MRTLASPALVAALTLLVAGPAAAQQLGPATAAGLNADAAAAARRVMMNALQHGGNHGGCAPLPGGWAILSGQASCRGAHGPSANARRLVRRNMRAAARGADRTTRVRADARRMRRRCAPRLRLAVRVAAGEHPHTFSGSPVRAAPLARRRRAARAH